jgi:hypothetical protein
MMIHAMWTMKHNTDSVELWRLNVAASIHCFHKTELNVTESILWIYYGSMLKQFTKMLLSFTKFWLKLDNSDGHCAWQNTYVSTYLLV